MWSSGSKGPLVGGRRRDTLLLLLPVPLLLVLGDLLLVPGMPGLGLPTCCSPTMPHKEDCRGGEGLLLWLRPAPLLLLLLLLAEPLLRLLVFMCCCCCC